MVAAVLSIVYTATYGALAYLIPGYLTFKSVEKRVGGEDAYFWAQYWVVLSALYLTQYALDFLLSWLPFYYLAKLFFIYSLWAPNLKVAATIYTKGLAQLLSQFEADIDRTVVEMRTKAGDLGNQYAGQAKTVVKDYTGRASVMLKDLQQKAMDKAKAAGKKAPTGIEASNGLHTE